MPTIKCSNITMRRNAMLLSDCILTDGTHVKWCCQCLNRENNCEAIGTQTQCHDCPIPVVLTHEEKNIISQSMSENKELLEELAKR